jgi:hypothetical protein
LLKRLPFCQKGDLFAILVTKYFKTCTKNGVDITNIAFYNERKEVILFDVVRSFGKDGKTTAEAIIRSTEVDEQLGKEIWAKVNSILSDTFTGQLAANKLLAAHKRQRTGDEDGILEELWCVLHTCSNLDKNGQKGLTEEAKEALQYTKLLFGSSKTSGYHQGDIKQT